MRRGIGEDAPQASGYRGVGVDRVASLVTTPRRVVFGQGLASRASGGQRLSESTASARVKAKRNGRGWASDSKLGQLFHSCLLGTDFPSGAQLTWCERVETPRHARTSRIWREGNVWGNNSSGWRKCLGSTGRTSGVISRTVAGRLVNVSERQQESGVTESRPRRSRWRMLDWAVWRLAGRAWGPGREPQWVGLCDVAAVSSTLTLLVSQTSTAREVQPIS